MAHAEQLSGLTDELVEVITGYSPSHNARAFKACKDAAVRSLKPHRFGRTSQFNVRTSLEGLVEKFQILSKDILADKLQQALVCLEERTYRWKPEALSLLLLLSHRPIDRVDVRGVKSRETADTPLPLTWNEIVADDPLTDKELWNDDNREVRDFFEDDITLECSTLFDQTDETLPSSLAEETSTACAESLIVPFGFAAFDKLHVAQSRQKGVTQPKAVRVTELEAIRGLLHMLLGLPSDLFKRKEGIGTSTIYATFELDHASPSSLAGFLSSLATTVNDLDILRSFNMKLQTIPLLQTFQACVVRYVQSIDSRLSEFEQSLTSIEDSCVVSLLGVFAELNITVEFIHACKDIITNLQHIAEDQSFCLLDQLYDCVCLADTMGLQEYYHITAQTFGDCLQTYMKPLRDWMEEGNLDDNDLLLPFVATGNNDNAKFWTKRYAIREQNGKPKAPQFLHEILPNIFASGKDVAFLKALDVTNKLVSVSKSSPLPISLQQIVHRGKMSFSPFPERFKNVLLDSILVKYRQTSITVRDHVLHGCGLWRTITALQVLYLSSDGSLTQRFSDAIFAKLDAGDVDWNNRSFVEEVVRATFGLNQHIDPANLHVQKLQPVAQQGKSMQDLGMIVFTLSYPWPVQNIIPTSTSSTFQSICTLLLQIGRARSLLSRQSLHVQSSYYKLRKNFSLECKTAGVNYYSLKQRLLWFVAALQDYMFNSTIAPTSLALRSTMQAATNIDGMISAHSMFIVSIEKGCLLGKQTVSVRSALLSLLDLIVYFVSMDEKDKQQRELHLFTDKDGGSSANLHRVNDEINISEFRQIDSQYHTLLAYMINGLRVAGRASEALPAWENLAEILETGMMISPRST